MSWIHDLLNSAKELESPQSYFYWSALTVISSVMKRKVWVDRGGVYKLYPNIYTFIISKRSGLRKGVPVNVAKKLATDIGLVRVIDGQNTMEGVLKELAKVKTIGNGYIIKDAQGLLITGEFASFLLTDGSGRSLTTLTDLYDAQYHESGFRKRLASQEELELKNPCLTGLFASNETHFFDSVPKNAISGGFLARTFCVYEDKRNTINSLTEPIKNQINYGNIINHLSFLSTLEGQIFVEPEANKLFDEWYRDFCSRDHTEEDETGTPERLGDNLWKAVMLIALANNEALFITVKDMEEGIFKVVETYTNLKRLLLGGSGDNKNISAITMRKVFSYILETKPLYEINRKVILRKGAGIFGVYDLDACIEHLLQAGAIKVDKRGQEVYYKFTKMVIERQSKIQGAENE